MAGLEEPALSLILFILLLLYFFSKINFPSRPSPFFKKGEKKGVFVENILRN
jgi:hypothetical protein